MKKIFFLKKNIQPESDNELDYRDIFSKQKIRTKEKCELLNFYAGFPIAKDNGKIRGVSLKTCFLL